MTANSLLFVKSHVNAFTRKDGTFVAAHDDKRTAAAPAASNHNMASFDKNWGDSVEHHGSEAKAAFAKGWDHENTKAKTGEAGREPTSRHLGDLSVHYKAGKAAAQRKIKLSGDADSGAHSAFDQHIDAYNAAGGQSSQPRTARPKNKAARAHSGSGAGNLVDHTAPANADVNEKHWGDTLSDDDNPTYVMRNLESTHLGHIASGKVDAKRLAHEELASRGQDSDGKWVGFDKAEEHHAALKGKSKPHPSNARVAEHLQSVGSDILSSVAKGHIDMKKRADAELDNRNHDLKGNWIKKT